MKKCPRLGGQCEADVNLTGEPGSSPCASIHVKSTISSFHGQTVVKQSQVLGHLNIKTTVICRTIARQMFDSSFEPLSNVE